MADTKKYYFGLGRRKSSTVRAMLTNGKGQITINDKTADDYLDHNEQLLWRLKRPLDHLDLSGKYDINLKALGGGMSGQVDAMVLAISKAVSEVSDDLRSTLKKAGFIKRDSREKERKKYGLKRARKKEQFSKR